MKHFELTTLVILSIIGLGVAAGFIAKELFHETTTQAVEESIKVGVEIAEVIG